MTDGTLPKAFGGCHCCSRILDILEGRKVQGTFVCNAGSFLMCLGMRKNRLGLRRDIGQGVALREVTNPVFELRRDSSWSCF